MPTTLSSTKRGDVPNSPAAAVADKDGNNKKAKLDKQGACQKKSPHDLYFDAFDEWLRNHKDVLGHMIVKGIESDDGDEDDEDEKEENEVNPSKHTEEQMRSLRYIMITQHRADQLKAMRELVLGDQANDCGFMMFNTSFSYQVADSWDHLRKKILPRKSPSQKLDILMAYTHNLKQWNVWMNDNEGDMGPLVKGLAGAWKKLMKDNSDESLGWDTEYTKPGILELLNQFQHDVDAIDDCYNMGTFKYM